MSPASKWVLGGAVVVTILAIITLISGIAGSPIVKPEVAWITVLVSWALFLDFRHRDTMRSEITRSVEGVRQAVREYEATCALRAIGISPTTDRLATVHDISQLRVTVPMPVQRIERGADG